MMHDPTYYELLGVERSATPAEIKSAFRQEAIRNHPDQGGNATLFRMIEEAYHTLISPSQRADYDHWLAEGATGTFGDGWSSDDWWEDDATAQYAGAVRQDAPTWTTSTQRAPVFERRAWRQEGDVIARRVLFALVVGWAVLAFLGGFPMLPGVGTDGVLIILVGVWLAWVMGSFVLRTVGICLAIWALASARWMDATTADTVIRICFAFLAWLAGHWLWALRHGSWHSIVAKRVLTCLPMALRPDRRWMPT